MHTATLARFRLCLLAALTIATLEQPGLLAGETMFKLLKVLKDKGSITTEEYQMLVDAAAEESVGSPKAATAARGPVVKSPSADSGGQPELPAAPPAKAAVAEAKAPAPKSHWYDKIGFRGYAQLRYTQELDSTGAALHVPNDSSASETSSFLLRRGRVILSGDATERLFVYVQADFNASLSSGETAVGMRDYYGDVALDEDKEFRVRLGQSKVPFGWVNLQSSQNRAPMERPDALNSAVEGERDIGAFFYWAPTEARNRFRDLVKSGLKGSGDYGVWGLGAYSGQGLNRLDLNGEPHLVTRLTYPWKLENGQFFETGLQFQKGNFVSPVSEISLGGAKFTPTRSANGVVDERVAATFVWYPQPFGIEAEWTYGRGPELDPVSRTVESETLHGGYVQLSYRLTPHLGEWYPFMRWQYYDGGRKFAANAPHSRVNEFDLGLEWQPWPAVELTVSYTHTLERTNTRLAPYTATDSADRVAFQAQLNF
jgi:phosphate-selective porin